MPPVPETTGDVDDAQNPALWQQGLEVSSEDRAWE